MRCENPGNCSRFKMNQNSQHCGFKRPLPRVFHPKPMKRRRTSQHPQLTETCPLAQLTFNKIKIPSCPPWLRRRANPVFQDLIRWLPTTPGDQSWMRGNPTRPRVHVTSVVSAVDAEVAMPVVIPPTEPSPPPSPSRLYQAPGECHWRLHLLPTHWSPPPRTPPPRTPCSPSLSPPCRLAVNYHRTLKEEVCTRIAMLGRMRFGKEGHSREAIFQHVLNMWISDRNFPAWGRAQVSVAAWIEETLFPEMPLKQRKRLCASFAKACVRRVHQKRAGKPLVCRKRTRKRTLNPQADKPKRKNTKPHKNTGRPTRKDNIARLKEMAERWPRLVPRKYQRKSAEEIRALVAQVAPEVDEGDWACAALFE